MRLLAQIAETVFWFTLWCAIPAALLYPVVLWMLNHTHYSGYFLIQGYRHRHRSVVPFRTGFLVDFIYRTVISQETTFKLRHYCIFYILDLLQA